MLYLFPFLKWLAPVTSAVLLVVLWKSGDLRPRTGTALVCWFLLAGYFQFFGATPVVSAVALALQTLLAAVLSMLWKLAL